MNIKGKKVLLRAIEKEDLPSIHKWSNDPEITTQLGGWHFPSSFTDQEKWYQNFSLSGPTQRFAAEAEGFGLIGLATLSEINWKDRNVVYGVIMGDKDISGNGFGTDISMAAARYVFEEMNLKRLDGTFISYNDASIHVHTKKCGWSVYGVKKGFYFRNNQWWDQVLAGITREEYFAHIEKTKYWEQ